MEVSHFTEVLHSTQDNKNATSHKFQFSYPGILEESKDNELCCLSLYPFKHSMPFLKIYLMK